MILCFPIEGVDKKDKTKQTFFIRGAEHTSKVCPTRNSFCFEIMQYVQNISEEEDTEIKDVELLNDVNGSFVSDKD